MNFSELVGKTITSVDESNFNVVHLTCSDGSQLSIDADKALSCSPAGIIYGPRLCRTAEKYPENATP